MTQFEHNMIAAFIHMLLWMFVYQRYFYDKQEYQWWMNFWGKIFK
jgi:hypothetical protein